MKDSYSFSLDSVLDEPLRFDFELPFSAEALGREPLVEISPVRIGGEVSRVEGGYSLEARLAYQGKLECSRCLVHYPFTSREEFSLLLYPRKPIAEGELSLEKDDLDTLFYGDPAVSVVAIAEERIQMAVPMKPLCREECRGICPHCGRDRNISECDCAAESIDLRWKALELLKKE